MCRRLPTYREEFDTLGLLQLEVSMTTAILYVLLVCGKPDFYMGVNNGQHLEHSAYGLNIKQKWFFGNILATKGAKVIQIEIQGICA